MKWREYRDRVRSMEHGSFTSLVFSLFGGLGREATVFYSRLADLLSKSTAPFTPRHFLYCIVVSPCCYFTQPSWPLGAIGLLYILSALLPLLICAWQRLNWVPNIMYLVLILQYCPALMPFCAVGGRKGHDILAQARKKSCLCYSRDIKYLFHVICSKILLLKFV